MPKLVTGKSRVMEQSRRWSHVWGMKAALVLLCLSLISNAQDGWKRALDRANGLRLTDPSGARREFQAAEHLAKQVDSKSLVRVWTDLAGFLIQQGVHRDAEAVLRKALVVQDQNLEIPAASRATVLNGLAPTQLALGRREESIDLLRKVIALQEGATGVDQGSLLPNLNLLTALYLETGRMHDAKLNIHKARRIATRIGTERDLAQTWIVLSEIERTVGNYDEARRAARSALKLMGPPNPDSSPLLEGAHNQLARIAYETLDYRTAATHWKLTLDSLSARRPDTDEEVLSLRADIARMALLQGRLQEVEKELLVITKLAEDHGSQIALARALFGLGTLYAKQKQFEKASRVLVRSLVITDQKFGEMSPHSALCVADLASIYLKTRQPAEAAKLSGRVARISVGDETVSMVWLDVMQIHAQVLKKLNRKAEAKEFHERASRFVASRRVKNHTIDVMDLMHR